MLFSDDGVTQYAGLGMALAAAYLAPKGIVLQPAGGDDIRLGKAVISPLDRSQGPYLGLQIHYKGKGRFQEFTFGSQGYQVLLDYHGGPQPFPQRSLSDVMDQDLAPVVRGRVVILGVAAESVKDWFNTPFSTAFYNADPIYGMVLHAHLADQLIRGALNGDPILGGMPRFYEAVFIWFWGVAGALVGAVLHTQLRAVGGIVAGLCVLGGIVYGAFGLALWLPGVPAALGWTLTVGGPASWEVAIFRRLQRQERELRRVRLLASGRQLLLLALMQQTDAADGANGTDYQSAILRELVAALAAVDPSKAGWTDG